ncbi:MAG: 50S ribosomal protein L17 [Candidatus Roizmanbacteria bacterium]
MRHGVRKIRFNWGKDANKMLMRKLAVNFLSKGYLQTTLSKAKALRPYLEKLVCKMKVESEANKNYLLRYLGDEKIINNGFKIIGPALSKINGGYVRIIKMNIRSSDGATMAKIAWAYPVILEEVKKIKKDEKPNTANKTS